MVRSCATAVKNVSSVLHCRPLLLVGCVMTTLAVLPGCTSEPPPPAAALAPQSSPDPLTGRPRSTATIVILEPQPGAVIDSDRVTVRVAVPGGTILERASNTLAPDTGHVHVALDGVTLTLLAGLEYEVTDIGPGPHLLRVEFAAADHGPFNPPVIANLPFTAR